MILFITDRPIAESFTYRLPDFGEDRTFFVQRDATDAARTIIATGHMPSTWGRLLKAVLSRTDVQMPVRPIRDVELAS